MKKLILLNGAMGVGKTTVGKLLCARLPRSAFLDGDWCFDLHPFVASPETKAMAVDNIAHLVNNYLTCSVCDHVVVNWVLDEKAVMDSLLSRISGAEVRHFILTCSGEALEARWRADKTTEWRTEEWLQVSRRLLPYFDALEGIHVDTTRLSPQQAAKRILGLIGE